MTDEQWQIRRFLELKGLMTGNVEFPDKPDALIDRGNHLLGIEHTRIFGEKRPGYDLRSFEHITNQIVSRAQNIFESTREEHLWVEVYFDTEQQLSKADHVAVPQELAEIVAQFVPPVGSDHRLDAWRFRAKGRNFPHAVKSIWINHRPEWGSPAWNVPRSTIVPELSVDTVQQHISGKEEKISVYRQRCSRIWLLLVVEGFAPSSHWGIDRFPFEHAFEFSFDKVFLYHQFAAETWELASC